LKDEHRTSMFISPSGAKTTYRLCLTRTSRNQKGLKIKKLITKARKYEDTKA